MLLLLLAAPLQALAPLALAVWTRAVQTAKLPAEPAASAPVLEPRALLQVVLLSPLEQRCSALLSALCPAPTLETSSSSLKERPCSEEAEENALEKNPLAQLRWRSARAPAGLLDLHEHFSCEPKPEHFGLCGGGFAGERPTPSLERERVWLPFKLELKNQFAPLENARPWSRWSLDERWKQGCETLLDQLNAAARRAKEGLKERQLERRNRKLAAATVGS